MSDAKKVFLICLAFLCLSCFLLPLCLLAAWAVAAAPLVILLVAALTEMK